MCSFIGELQFPLVILVISCKRTKLCVCVNLGCHDILYPGDKVLLKKPMAGGVVVEYIGYVAEVYPT